MEEIKNASISINLSEGNINISGSEEFVEKNMEIVFSFVERANNIKKNKIKESSQAFSEPAQKVEANDKAQNDSRIATDKDKYKKLGIYSVDAEDGTISIHRKIPGRKNAEKMKNVALIVLFEKGEPIEGTTLKALCEKQGCWDSGNASAIFERDIVNFIKKKKSKQKWTLELTIDGENTAIELLEGMINDKK